MREKERDMRDVTTPFSGGRCGVIVAGSNSPEGRGSGFGSPATISCSRLQQAPGIRWPILTILPVQRPKHRFSMCPMIHETHHAILFLCDLHHPPSPKEFCTREVTPFPHPLPLSASYLPFPYYAFRTLCCQRGSDSLR